MQVRIWPRHLLRGKHPLLAGSRRAGDAFPVGGVGAIFELAFRDLFILRPNDAVYPGGVRGDARWPAGEDARKKAECADRACAGKVRVPGHQAVVVFHAWSEADYGSAHGVRLRVGWYRLLAWSGVREGTAFQGAVFELA